MPAGAWVYHDSLFEEMAAKAVDIENDTFKIILCGSASNANDTSVVALAAITNQLATGNGYVQNDKAIDLADNQVGSVYTITADSPAWTAAGGNIGPFRYAVIYDDSHPSDLIIAHCVVDATPQDLTIFDGQTGTISAPSGVVVVQPAA